MKPAKSTHTHADMWIRKIARVYVLAIFTLLPFVISQDSDTAMAKNSAFVFLTVVCIVVAAFVGVFALIQDTRSIGAQLGKLRKEPLFWLVIAYVAVLLLSTLFSNDKTAVLRGFTSRDESLPALLLYLFVFCFVAQHYRRSTSDFVVLCTVGLVISLYGLCAYYGFEPIFGESEGITGQVLRHYPFVGNKTYFAIYLNILFFFALVLYIKSRARIRFFFAGAALVFFYALLCVNMDSGYVGLFTALALAVPILLVERYELEAFAWIGGGCALLFLLFQALFPLANNFGAPTRFLIVPVALFAVLCVLLAVLCRKTSIGTSVSRQRLVRIYFIILLIVVIAAWVILPLIADWSDSRTLREAAELSRGRFSDEMGSDRGFYWRRAFELFKQKPLLGHGPDQFSPVFMREYNIEMSSYFSDNLIPDKTHNEYIQRLVDTGLLGLLCSLAIQGYMLYRAWRSKKTPLVAAAGVVCVAYMAQAFFTFVNPLTTPIMCIVFGMIRQQT